MRILVGHNAYYQFGGEDAVVRDEERLLRDFGEDVYFYRRSNQELENLSLAQKFKFLLTLSWQKQSYREVCRIIRKFRPDIAHFHNIFYVMSPAVYQACQDEGVPVVQSLHNFRPVCLNGLFFRDGNVCEDCLNASPWTGAGRRCFRGSWLMSALLARMLLVHQRRKTWQQAVDRYIVAAEFTRQKYIAAGIPAEKISLKPHFVFAPDSWQANGEYALYVGRLSQEKGVEVLLAAWKDLKDVTLRIVGDGPLMEKLRQVATSSGITNVEFLGHVSDAQYEQQMMGAKFLVVPSVCYENFPRIVVEAYARAKPVIASDLGSLRDLVDDKSTGLLFKPGEPDDLRRQVRWCVTHPQETEAMAHNSRKIYEERFTPQKNYEMLLDIYQQMIATYSRS